MSASYRNRPLKTGMGNFGRASLRVAILALFGLGLAFGSCGILHAATATPVAQSSAGVSAAAGNPQTQSKTKRREEIRQKKIDNPEVDEGANLYRHSPNVQKVARFFGWSTEVTSRLFEIVNFIILIVGIVWLVARILPKALRARSERIQAELQQARIATEDADRRLAKIEERLSRLDSEIDTIRSQAEQETAIEEKRLRAALEQEKQGILDAAAQDIAAAAGNAESLLKNLAAELVIEHAKRRIKIGPETDRSLVHNFLTDLNGDRGKNPRGGVN